MTTGKGAARQPRYLRIAESIRTGIRSGRLRPGEALASTRELAETHGTHRHTVMAALDELVAEGWLVNKPRSPFRVCETLPNRFFEPSDPGGPKPCVPPHAWKLARRLTPPSPGAEGKTEFNFRSGIPDLRLFPQDEFRSFLLESLKRSGRDLLGYGPIQGHAPFLKELSSYLRRMRAVSDRELVVTHGSQEAIFLVGQLLLSPGDRVAVEELAYPPACHALRAAGAELRPIRVDREGLDPEHLEAVLKKGRVRLIHLTPLHHYPTTVTLPVARRLRLYELACRYDVPILEDDYDHEYHYRCQPLPPLAAEDPAGRVIYVSTFSKVFAPSARLGFVALPPALAHPLQDLKRLVTRQNDALLQDALGRWMRDGGFERHLRRTRRQYEERRDAMNEALERARAEGARIRWNVPHGGMALWVETQGDSSRITERALKAGIAVAHAEEFRIGQGRAQGLRLGFARHSPGEIQRGMSLLSRILLESERKDS